MGIIKHVKKFFAARTLELPKIEPSDGPFDYEYVSISHVVGLKLQDGLTDPLQIASFPNSNATVYLTHDISKHDVHIHRSTAYTVVMLKGYLGVEGERFKKLYKWIDIFLVKVFGFEWCFLKNLSHEERRIKMEDSKRHSNSGCYLIYKAKDRFTDSLDSTRTRRFSRMGLALDGVDKSKIRNKHEMSVKNASTALSIAMTGTNGSPDIKFICDDFHLIGKDGLIIYLRNFIGGGFEINSIINMSSNLITEVNKYLTSLNQGTGLSSAISNYAASNLKTNDNLRAFIASWSAFELLINYIEIQVRKKFRLLLNNKTITLPLPPSNRNLKGISPNNYNLGEKFCASACVLNFAEASNDISDFKLINKTRNDYYHALKIKDSELPTKEVQSLIRKYLKLVL